MTFRRIKAYILVSMCKLVGRVAPKASIGRGSDKRALSFSRFPPAADGSHQAF